MDSAIWTQAPFLCLFVKTGFVRQFVGSDSVHLDHRFVNLPFRIEVKLECIVGLASTDHLNSANFNHLASYRYRHLIKVFSQLSTG